MVDQTRPRFGPIQIGIIVLTLATAVIHLTLNFPDTLFILNGLGYLALLAALYLPMPQLADNRDLIRWVFIAYTVVTIIAWIVMGEQSRNMFAYATKAIEVVLIVLLYLDLQQ